jgi:hypothetical protein
LDGETFAAGIGRIRNPTTNKSEFQLTGIFELQTLWFTDLAAVSPEEPARTLEQVFLTPKDFDKGVL